MWWIQSSLNSAKKKYLETGKLDEELFNELSYLDPTQNKKYLEWLCSHSDMGPSSLYSLFLLCLLAQDIVPGFNFQDQYQGKGKRNSLKKKLSEFSSYWIKRACNLNSLTEGKDYEILSVQEDERSLSNPGSNLSWNEEHLFFNTSPKALQVFSLISEKGLVFQYPFYQVLLHVKTQKGMTAIGSKTPWCIVPASNTYWDNHYHLYSGNKLFVSSVVLFGGFLLGLGNGRKALIAEPQSRSSFKVFQAVNEQNKGVSLGEFSNHAGLPELRVRKLILNTFDFKPFDDLSPVEKFFDLVAGNQIQIVPGKDGDDPSYEIKTMNLKLTYKKEDLKKNLGGGKTVGDCFKIVGGEPHLARLFPSWIISGIKPADIDGLEIKTDCSIWSLGEDPEDFPPISFGKFGSLDIITGGNFFGFGGGAFKRSNYLSDVTITAGAGVVSLEDFSGNSEVLTVSCKSFSWGGSSKGNGKIRDCHIHFDPGVSNEILADIYKKSIEIKYLKYWLEGNLITPVYLYPGAEHIFIYNKMDNQNSVKIVSDGNLSGTEITFREPNGAGVIFEVDRCKLFDYSTKFEIRDPDKIEVPDLCNHLKLRNLAVRDFSFLRGKVVLEKCSLVISELDPGGKRSFKGLEEFSCPNLILNFDGPTGEWDLSYLPTHIRNIEIKDMAGSPLRVGLKKAINDRPNKQELVRIFSFEEPNYD